MIITDMKSLPSEKTIAINLTTIGAADLFLRLPKYFIDEKGSVSVLGAEPSKQGNNIASGSHLCYHLKSDLASKETFVSIKLADQQRYAGIHKRYKRYTQSHNPSYKELMVFSYDFRSVDFLYSILCAVTQQNDRNRATMLLVLAIENPGKHYLS
jgi:hypothetical protein